VIGNHQYMNIAREVARSSKCVSVQVGAIIVKDDRIISTGYNGTPKGYTNCCDVWTESGEAHSAWSADHEIHAEMNAIIFAARAGLSIEGGTMYTTLSPCRQCLKHLSQAGIQILYYAERYKRTSDDQMALDYKFCGPDFNLLHLR